MTASLMQARRERSAREVRRVRGYDMRRALIPLTLTLSPLGRGDTLPMRLAQRSTERAAA